MSHRSKATEQCILCPVNYNLQPHSIGLELCERHNLENTGGMTCNTSAMKIDNKYDVLGTLKMMDQKLWRDGMQRRPHSCDARVDVMMRFEPWWIKPSQEASNTQNQTTHCLTTHEGVLSFLSVLCAAHVGKRG